MNIKVVGTAYIEVVTQTTKIIKITNNDIVALCEIDFESKDIMINTECINGCRDLYEIAQFIDLHVTQRPSNLSLTIDELTDVKCGDTINNYWTNEPYTVWN